MLFTVVLAFLGFANLAYALLNLQLLRGLRRLRPGPPTPEKPKNPATPASSHPVVTVLIAARNEEDRIRKTMDCLLAQDYAADKLQVVVVDDRSQDKTGEILREYAISWPGNLEVVSLSEGAEGVSPKKFALGQGMRIAKGEIIVTTDADCIMSPAWVSSLVAEFAPGTGLVLGMTSYYREPDYTTLIWGTQALEFISYGIVASALIGLRFPVHGNANNIAYRRKVYDLASGFASHHRIVSGDDDFLIQSIHGLGEWEIRYSVHSQSQVQTEPPLSLRQFWEQRKRWASKCGFYQPKQVAFLGAIFAYYCLIPVCLIAGCALSDFPLLALGAGSWLIKTASDYVVMAKGLRVFSKRELLRYFPLAALIHIPLIIAAVLVGSFGQFTWKGQTVKGKL